ncbi:CRISPR-associated endonuclease Cas1 [uncultured Ilyobacter sp.]|uniref:CRISPR-associated endonuclease Cas1 n=1 Tax=uncultured Ilyobacter sp. TaxID=544433 RepID=UPI0029C60C6F|nr:CRISPR-associated endonuclease Cas1 [uncultured Ilyobacter sp.]
MEVTVETKGTKISKSNNIFKVRKVNNEEIKLSYNQVSSFVLYPGVSITTDAVCLALEKNVEIYFMDEYGLPLGKIWDSRFGSTSLIRREQYRVFSSEAGSEIGKEFILKKADAYMEQLKKFSGYSSEVEKIEKFSKSIAEIKGYPEDIRNSVMGYEGNIGKVYFSVLSKELPAKYKFDGRNKEGGDYFNNLLNYVYGILYRVCEKELVKAGLDPFLGIFHSDSYNKKSFLFDFIEEFRPDASKIAFDFIKKKYVRENYFDSNFKLSQEGRREISQFFRKNFEKKIFYMKKNWDKYSVIRLEAQRVAKILKGDEDEVSDIL